MWKVLSPPITLPLGRKARHSLSDKLGAEGGEVAIIEGKAGNASGEARRERCRRNLREKQAEIKLVASQPADWDRIKALDVATNVLQRNPNIKAIYCANDTMAMGVAQAVANAGKTGKVLVVRYRWHSGSPQNGGSRTNDRDGCQNPADIGATGLKLMVDAEKSGKVIPLDKARNLNWSIQSWSLNKTK